MPNVYIHKEIYAELEARDLDVRRYVNETLRDVLQMDRHTDLSWPETVNAFRDTTFTFECIPLHVGFNKSGRPMFAYKFYCPFCQAWHTHSSNQEKGKGHRVAHCTIPNSPLKEKGYYVKYADSAVLEEMIESLKSYLAIQQAGRASG